MSVEQYAAWALLFSLGSGSIILDLGAFQLAQIIRAEGRLSTNELIRLLGFASVAPLVLLGLTTVFWHGFLQTFVDGAAPAGAGLPFLLGLAALLRAWQNVANGIALGGGDDAARKRSALTSAAVQLACIGLVVVLDAEYALSIAYLLGGIVGFLALTPVLRRALGDPPPRGANQVGLRAAIGALGVTLTQVDRLIVAAVVTPAGLAAYDFAARLVSTVKLACVLVATGAAAQSAGAASDQERRTYLEAAQHFLDRLALCSFTIAPLAVLGITSLLKPELTTTATLVALILSVGHGVNATTATVTGYLSGIRRPRPEIGYLAGAVLIMVATAWPLGELAGAPGVAASVATGLCAGSTWLRWYGSRRVFRSSLAQALEASRGRGEQAESPTNPKSVLHKRLQAAIASAAATSRAARGRRGS